MTCVTDGVQDLDQSGSPSTSDRLFADHGVFIVGDFAAFVYRFVVVVVVVSTS